MDEYAQARNTAGKNGADLKNVLTSSMGPRREPLTMIITTASDVIDGPFAHELEGVKKVLRGEAEADTMFASLFMPDVDDEENDPHTWAKVQPHLGITVQPDFYEKEYETAQLSAENMLAFRTKLLNVFAVNDETAWLPEKVCQSLMGDFDIDHVQGKPSCAVAFDLSVHDDFSAVAYTIYAASSIKAAGTLFNTVLGIDSNVAMYIAAAIIVGYTFMGGFSAVCWTDFFQGMLMLGALLLAPIFAAANLPSESIAITDTTPGFFSLFASKKDIISGLGWGLGYFGMPHIIIRFMSVESQKSLKRSAKIGITWTTLILIFSVLVGVIGRMYMNYDENIAGNSLVFIEMVRRLFPSLLSGILLSAILAAAMSTADSQLLSAASAFSSDVYKPVLRKNKTSDNEMLWTGRIVVVVIALLALVLALNPNAGSIMDLVSNAWGVFGAAFGPAILLSLFWKRFTFKGAVSGIAAGALVDIGWLILHNSRAAAYAAANPGLAYNGIFAIYEIVPGFIAGLVAAIVITLIDKKPGKEVEALFDQATSSEALN